MFSRNKPVYEFLKHILSEDTFDSPVELDSEIIVDIPTKISTTYEIFGEFSDRIVLNTGSS